MEQLQKNYWLHRIKSGDIGIAVSTPLLFERNILSIGWSDLSTENFLEHYDTEFNKAFAAWGNPRNRWCLNRFLKEMKKGDIVLVPTPYEFSLFEITSDQPYSCEKLDMTGVKDWNGNEVEYRDHYIYRKNSDDLLDVGFFWNVKPIMTHISRAYADAALYSRMKIQQINANITDLSKDVEKALERAKAGKPVSLYAEIAEQGDGLVLEKINKYLNADKFEKVVGKYFEKLGAHIEVPAKNSSKTEEGDTDVIAYFDEIKVAIRVQIKWHQGTTDADAVDQIVTNADKYQSTDYYAVLWVISSATDFTDAAKRKAEESNVRLIDGKMFSNMLLRAGLTAIETL